MCYRINACVQVVDDGAAPCVVPSIAPLISDPFFVKGSRAEIEKPTRMLLEKHDPVRGSAVCTNSAEALQFAIVCALILRNHDRPRPPMLHARSLAVPRHLHDVLASACPLLISSCMA